MSSYTKYIFCLFLLLFITSCATIKKEIPTVKDATVSNNALTTAQTKFSDYANIRIRASIRIKFPDMSNSANAVIEMAKKDSILISITGPFGISAGKLYANPNEFIMNNNLQNMTFTGIPTEKNIMQIVNIPLSFNDLMSIFRTSISQNTNDYDYNSELSTNELSLFQLKEFSDETANERLYEELIYVNLNNDIVKMERKNILGQTIIVANFAEHSTVGKYRFANKLNLDFPILNGNVEIKISDISIILQPTTPMRFSKPRSYQERRYE